MRKQIAEITLAPGNSSFYDDTSKILLNLNKKTAPVFEETNVAGLIAAIRAGKIKVVSGTLSPGTIVSNTANSLPAYYRLEKALKKTRVNVHLSGEIKKPEEHKKHQAPVEDIIVPEEKLAEDIPEVKDELKIEQEVEIPAQEPKQTKPRKKRVKKAQEIKLSEEE